MTDQDGPSLTLIHLTAEQPRHTVAEAGRHSQGRTCQPDHAAAWHLRHRRVNGAG